MYNGLFFYLYIELEMYVSPGGHIVVYLAINMQHLFICLF